MSGFILILIVILKFLFLIGGKTTRMWTDWVAVGMEDMVRYDCVCLREQAREL